VVTLCQAFRKGLEEVKKWFSRVFKRIMKIAKKEKRKSKQGSLKPSPRDILYP
jgi:hypothetical protein